MKAKEKRIKSSNLRMTPDEYAIVAEAAVSSNSPLAVYIREVAIEYALKQLNQFGAEIITTKDEEMRLMALGRECYILLVDILDKYPRLIWSQRHHAIFEDLVDITLDLTDALIESLESRTTRRNDAN
jgi:uncharacterized protein (DUF1778 family)